MEWASFVAKIALQDSFGVLLGKVFNSELAMFREPEYDLWKSSVFSYSPVTERSRRDSEMRGVGEFLGWIRRFRNCNVMYLIHSCNVNMSCYGTFMLCPLKLYA